MCSWLRTLLGQTKTRETTTICRFGPSDNTLSQDDVTLFEEGWMIHGGDDRAEDAKRLFEIAGLDVEQCLLTYRAAMRSEGLEGRAFLEMWVRITGKGEFFSKGFNQSIRGTTDWASYEIPFRLKKGQHADLVKLNLVMEGKGTVWLKDVELLKTLL